jgi:Uma2 family endonuclease
MADPAKRQATYADIEALPPHVVGEILFGSLVTHPRPSPTHSKAQATLGRRLGGPFEDGTDGPGGWVFLMEPELHLGGNVVVPDLGGWRRERLTPWPDGAYISVPPDWICEILSPATERHDRNEKRDIYGRAGVPFLWLLDPRVKVLECFRLVAGQWLLLGTVSGTNPVRMMPFDAVEFDLGSLWPFDVPPPET